MMTGVGVILGTAAYMAPEQARGKPVDKRADIWAFGCVLYEMLTARRAFQAEDISLTLAEVMKSEPAFDALPLDVPPRVRQVLRVCLQKDPRQRGGDIAAIRLALDGAFDAPTAIVAAAATRRAAWRRAAPWALSGALGLIVASLGWLLPPGSSTANVVTRLQVLLPDDAAYGNTYTPALNLAVSPDGRLLAYVAGERLMMRSLDRLDVRELAAADGIRNPFFSPDGAWVGYTAGLELRKVRVGGDGSSVLVTSGLSSTAAGGVWNDGDIIYGDGGSGLFRVSAEGGLPERIVSAAGDDSYHRPVLVAGTENLLVNIGPTDSPDIGIVDLATGERATLVPNARLVTYTRSGHLIFQRDGVVMGAAFDAGTRAIGSAVPVLSGVAGDNGLRMPQAVLSDSGVLVYVSEGAGAADTVLAWRGPDGAVDVLGTLPAGSHSVSLSPDGRLAAIGRRTVPRQVVLWDMERRAPTRLSLDGTNPRWHPDGRRIGLGGGEFLRLFNVDDSREEALGEPATLADPPSWSADGATVVYSVQRPGRDIVAITAGAPEPVTIEATDGNDAAPALSPDGRWLAYVSNQTGTFQVYVARFPSGTGRRQVSTLGGKAPLWGRDGRSLYYVEENGPATPVMTVVPVESTDPLVLGAPRPLFPMIDPDHDRHSEPLLPWGAVYDVADDGRVLMVWEPDQRYTELVVVQNWLDELTRIVPTN